MKYSLTCLDQCMCLLQFQHDPLSSHLEPKETEKETKESNKVLLLRIHNSAAMQIVLFRFKKAKSYLRLLQHVSVVIHVKPKSWTVETPMPILRSILSYTQEVKWCGPYRLGQCRLHYGWHITLQYYNCSLKHYTCIQKNPASKILTTLFFLKHIYKMVLPNLGGRTDYDWGSNNSVRSYMNLCTQHSLFVNYCSKLNQSRGINYGWAMVCSSSVSPS